MLQLIRELLQQLIDDIDSRNSKMSQEQQLEAIELLQKLIHFLFGRKRNELISKELSKIEAADYIGVSRATFDNYIIKGLIPKGRKRQGVNNLFWSKYDLDKFLNNE